MSYQGRARGRKGRIAAKKQDALETKVAERAAQARTKIYDEGFRTGADRMRTELMSLPAEERLEHDMRTGGELRRVYIASFPSVAEQGPTMMYRFPQPRARFAADVWNHMSELQRKIRFYATEHGLAQKIGDSRTELRWFTWNCDEPGVKSELELRRIWQKLDHVEHVLEMTKVDRYDTFIGDAMRLLSEATKELRIRFGKERVQMSEADVYRRASLVRQGASLEFIEGGLP